MYKNISTTTEFPKTLVVRNTPDGMIWQIYHVKTERGAKIIAEGADRGGFEGVTLENHQPELEETFPNWQNDIRNSVELRLLEGGNKIDYLLRKELITLDDIELYTKQWMNALDAFDNEQIDKYYSNQYGDNNVPDVSDGEWECGAGTLHPSTMSECDCFKYEEDVFERELRDEMMMLEDLYGDEISEAEKLQDQMLRDEMKGIEEDRYGADFDIDRNDDPQYIIASTSYKMNETYIFEADEKGEILNYSEFGGLCERHGDKDWNNREKTVQSVFPDKYDFVSTHPVSSQVYHSLYKRKA